MMIWVPILGFTTLIVVFALIIWEATKHAYRK